MLKIGKYLRAATACLPLLYAACGGNPVTGAGAYPTPAPAAEAKRPNIRFFMADDMGYRGLGSYGAPAPDPKIHGHSSLTPSIDRLSMEGIRFTNAYVTVPLCAPSRASVLTGNNPPRTRVFWNPPEDFRGITFANVLRDKYGYDTAFFGKLHQVAPAEQLGFSHAVYEFNANGADAYFGRYYNDRAMEWFRNRDKGRPWLMCMWYHDPHDPYELPREEDFKPSGLGLYWDMIGWLDRYTGELISMQDAEMSEDEKRNTLTIFVSDNGAPVNKAPKDANGVYSGGKGSCLEGGIRVPFVMHWPARIKPGVSDTRVSMTDIFDTLIDAANIDNRTLDYPTDGISLMPLILGGPFNDRKLYFWGTDGACAVKYRDNSGDWKYLRPGSWNTGKTLHNLLTDPTENINLYWSHRELADMLEADLQAAEDPQGTEK